MKTFRRGVKRTVFTFIPKCFNLIVIFGLVFQPVGTVGIWNIALAQSVDPTVPVVEETTPAPVEEAAPVTEPEVVVPAEPVVVPPTEEPTPIVVTEPVVVPPVVEDVSIPIETPAETPVETPAPIVTETPVPATEPVETATNPVVPVEVAAPVTEVAPVSQEIVPEVTPAEPVDETECLAASATASSESDWSVSGDRAVTNDAVELGVRYIFPLDEEVTITFTCLPTDLSKRALLSIERINASDLNLPAGTVAVSEYAYDITTDGMENGTFKYDLSLPKFEGMKDADISYIEMSADEVKGKDLSDSDVKKVDGDNVDNKDGSIEATGQDHFSVHVATQNAQNQAGAGGGGNASANLDQCANGGVGDPAVPCTGSAWQNGNLNGNGAHYREGDSVPYRFVMSNLSLGTHSITIEWDTTQGGVHATDYLTTFNRTEGSADPCSGVVGCGSPSTYPIPTDPNAISQISGFFTLYGGTINSVSSYTLSGSYAGNSSTSITITFTASTTNPVLAVGGHIASQIDWGAGNSASGISGSPYHMRLIDLDGTGGNQDRSLSAEAVPAVPNITTQASPSSIYIGQTVTDTASLSGSGQNPPTVTGSVKFFVCGPDNTNPNCTSGGTQVGGTKTIVNGQVTSDTFTPTQIGSYCFRAEYIPDANAEYSPIHHTNQTTECFSVTNPPTGHIIVDKVTNPSGDQQSFSFSTTGTGYISFSLTDQAVPNNQELTTGTYSVSETLPAGWTQTSATCSDGSLVSAIDLSSGETVTCTFTNTKKAHLIVQKTSLPAADPTVFSINTTSSTGGTITNGGAGTVTDTTDKDYEVTPGTYSVAETVPAGWTKTGDTCQNVVVTAGQTAYCLLTNAKDATLKLVKSVTNNNGGGAVPHDWTLAATGTNGFSDFGDSTSFHTVSTGVGYALSESTVAGYTASGWVCDGGSLVNSTVTLSAGQNVTCTITNNDDVPSLTLVKQVENNNVGAAVASNWILTATGAGQNPTNLSGTTPVTSGLTFKADTYTLAELNGPTGYTASVWTCTNNVVVTNSQITLTNGVSTTCTIVNTRDTGTLRVLKNVDLNGDGDYTDANETGATNWLWQANDGASHTTGDGAITVGTGDFALTETAQTNFHFVSLTCDGGTLVGNTVTVAKDATVVCTFTNARDTGNLKAVKVVDDGSDLTQWYFALDGGSPIQADVNGEVDFGQVTTVTPHTIVESGPGAYHFVNVTGTNCTQNGSGSASATVAKDGTTVCTFSNAVNKGTITIIKNALPDDAQDFAFTTTGTGLSAFSLDDDADGTLSNTRTFTNLFPGAYAVTEDAVAGWDLTSATCSDGSLVSAINVAAGETVTCTFTNTKRGSIIVEKQTTPDGAAGSYTFTGTAAGTISDNGQIVVNNLVPGTYTSTENSPSPVFTLTGLVCDDGQSATPSTANLGTRTATFKVDPGETVKCTFTNTEQGTLTLVKNTIGGNGTFNFTTTGGLSPASPSITTVSNTGSQAYSNIVPGTYSFAETVPAGWDLTSATCSDGSPVSAVEITAGESVTCTFTNTKRGNITIVKDVISNPNPQDFTFHNNFGNGNDTTFLLDEDTTETLSSSRNFEVLPGTYSVSEDALTGWQSPESTSCTDGSPVNAIVVAPGESVTCTFVNEELAKIVLMKNTVGGNDTFDFDATGTGLPADIDLTTVVGTVSQTFSDLDQDNAYTIAENTPAGWDLTSAVCDRGETPDDIDIEPGETVTCTFTNTKRGSITIVKNTTGGDATFNFTGTVGVTQLVTNSGTASQTVSNVLPGTYSISETVPTSWDLNSATCSDQSPVNAINVAAGETVTCTFTNTKKGHLIVHKVTDPVGDTTEFSVTASGNGAISGNVIRNISTVLDADYEVTPGMYSVNEAAKAGWDEISNTCDDVVVAAGATVECTITNQKDAFVVVDKVTDPTGDQTLFDFTTNYSSPFSLADGSVPNNSGDLVPGTYSVTEGAETGWNLTNTMCVSSKGDTETVGTISLQAGETVTCTFTNTKKGHLTVQKTTLPSGDQTSFAINTTGTGSITGGGAGSVTDATDKDYEVTPGTFSVAETVPTGWDKTGDTCQSVVVGAGETKYCLLTNTKRGSITIEKQTVGSDGDFVFTGDVTGTLSDDETTTVEVAPGTYSSIEGAQTGWDLTDITCSDGRSTTPSTGNTGTGVATFNVEAGENVTCTFTNTKRGTVIVTKYEDEDGDGIRDEGEVTLEGWNMHLSQGEPFSANEMTDVSGQATFDNLVNGSYTLSESEVEGWTLTNISCSNDEQGDGLAIDNDNDHPVSVAAGEIVNCEIGNQYALGTLEITKTNNEYANGPDQPGTVVTYTITVKAVGGLVRGVSVVDLPPEGFAFVSGSDTAVSTNGDHVGLLELTSVYASPGVWSLGDLAKDEIVTLTYQTLIGNVDDGDYPDLAYAYGTGDKNGVSGMIYASSAPSEFPVNNGIVDETYVGTQIDIVSPLEPVTVALTNTVERNVDTKTVTRVKRVLGASTVLPATGANTQWLFLALALFLGGIGLILWSKRRRQLLIQSDVTTTMIKSLFLALFASILLFPGGSVLAVEEPPMLNIRIETPKAQVSDPNFKIGFVVLDRESPTRTITVECWKVGDEGPFETHALTSGGNSGDCQVGEEEMTPEGVNYGFYTKARTTSGTSETATSETVYVKLISGTPSTPLNYSRSSCTVNFTTANDGLTEKVELYRSTSSTFTADTSTFVDDVPILPNTPGTVTDTAGDCGSGYYYAIRAVAASDLGSGFVGDENVVIDNEHKIKYRTDTKKVAGKTVTSGAIPVTTGGGSAVASEGEGAVEGASTVNEEGEKTGVEQPKGSVLGEATEQDGENDGWVDAIKAHPWRTAFIALILLLLAYRGYQYYQGRYDHSIK